MADGTRGLFFTGRIRDARIYDAALSAADIQQLFEQQADLTGIGTPEYPYKVRVPNQLVAIGSNEDLLKRHYILIHDISFIPDIIPLHVFDKAVIAPYDSQNDGQDRFPVFSGTFDGGGHNISNLTIRGAGYLGLFGMIGPEGTVRNLGLEDVDIVSGVNGSINIGGLCGKNEGSIKNCYTTGSIDNADVDCHEIGGLCGYCLLYTSPSPRD